MFGVLNKSSTAAATQNPIMQKGKARPTHEFSIVILLELKRYKAPEDHLQASGDDNSQRVFNRSAGAEMSCRRVLKTAVRSE